MTGRMTAFSAAVAYVWVAAEWLNAPHVPVASEVIGLAAVLVAPGMAAEGMLTNARWTSIERAGLALILSVCACIIVGLTLHLLGLPVSTIAISVGLALWATGWLLASHVIGDVRAATRSSAVWSGRRGLNIDVIVGLTSLTGLIIAGAIILTVRQPPPPPTVEVAIFDQSGALEAQPLHIQDDDRGGLQMWIRAQRQTGTGDVDLSVAVDGRVVWWGSRPVTAGWSQLEVPLPAMDPGRHEVVVEAVLDGAGTKLDLEVVLS